MSDKEAKLNNNLANKDVEKNSEIDSEIAVSKAVKKRAVQKSSTLPKTDSKAKTNTASTATKTPVTKNKTANIGERTSTPNLAVKTAQLVDKKNLEQPSILTADKASKPAPKKTKFFLFKKKRINPKSLSEAERYSPDLKKGLTTNQVKTRKVEMLFNDVDNKYTKSYKSIFFGNFFTFFNFLCFFTAGALIYAKAPLENMFFLLIFVSNIIIGIILEIKAKLSIEKLSLVSSPTSKVVRNGIVLDIGVKELVLDDIIILTTGNQIPTDCILADGLIEVNESLLTGESVPVRKDIGDLLLAGSFISSGNCKARAEKVGKFNYIQKLTSKAKKYKKPNSELMNSLKLIMTIIGILIIPISVLMFGTNYNNVTNLNSAIYKTAAVVIGMIPAGMFLLTSMALAVGVIRLSKNNTLVQDLYSLEMLARVDVLCLDKTGTITDGRMKVSECMLLKNSTNFTINEILGTMLAVLNDNNQTSLALYNHFGHSNVLKAQTILPFSSKRKLSAVTFADVGTFVLGAPEFVMQNLPDKIDRLVDQYARMGLRVLLIAHSTSGISGEKLPAQSTLKPLALIAIADNIREDAVQTIKWFKDNDVKVKVISGDNPVTVSEVARRVGITNAEKYISLEGLNDKEVASIANKYTVFGRVSPEQKAILIKALKASGSTVAMTGDGVNDILALKEADCSISVASGSEAARNISHLVLKDNNFSSLPKVVFEGRRVINNIQKSSSLYLMKTLFTTIFAVISILLKDDYPFTTSNLIMLEIFIIGIPSFALSLQPNSSRVQGKFMSYVLSRSVPCGVVLVLNVLFFKYLNNFIPVDIVNYSKSPEYYKLATLAITFSGLVMLYRISQPMNFYRSILFTAMFAICFVASAYYNNGKLFAEVVLSWEYIVLLICVILIDFPLSKWLMNFFDKLRTTSTSKDLLKMNDTKHNFSN